MHTLILHPNGPIAASKMRLQFIRMLNAFYHNTRGVAFLLVVATFAVTAYMEHVFFHKNTLWLVTHTPFGIVATVLLVLYVAIDAYLTNAKLEFARAGVSELASVVTTPRPGDYVGREFRISCSAMISIRYCHGDCETGQRVEFGIVGDVDTSNINLDLLADIFLTYCKLLGYLPRCSVRGHIIAVPEPAPW